MKKNIYFKNNLLLVLFFIVTGTGAFAQVGIGTTNPQPSAILELESTNKGLLVPRVALTGRTDISTITSPAISLLAYNTATMGTAPNNVVPGYYFWNGSAWVQIVDDNFGSTTGVGGIYKGSGSLSGNTTVTQSANTLAFTSNAVNGFSVDGTTFSVDAANNRVGIGTNSPTEKFELTSGVANDSGMKFTNLTSSSPVSSGKALAVDANGKVVTISTASPTAVILAENLPPTTISGTNSFWSFTYNHQGGNIYVNAQATCYTATGGAVSLTFQIKNALNQVVISKNVLLPASNVTTARIPMPVIVSSLFLEAGTYSFSIFKTPGFTSTFIDLADVASISCLVF